MLLTVPPQSPLPGVDTRIGVVRKWVDQLAYTNALDTAHQLIGRLRDLHHQTLDSGHRHELLLCFLEAFQRLHEPLRRPPPATDDPMGPARLHSLDRLTEELLIGFKYVINDAQQERHLLRRPKHLHQAVPLTMHLIALLLAVRYQSYLPTDSQLWREAGTLLRYSQDNLRGPRTVPTPIPFAGDRLDSAGSYALMAFLRLCDPFRLPHATLWDCFGFLAAQIRRSGLQARPDAPDTPRARAVCIDCEPDEWRQAPPEDTDPARWYWLDPAPLLAAIEEAVPALEQGAPASRFGLTEAIGRRDAVQLLQRLRDQLTDPPQRRLERFESGQAVQLAVGLEACFYLHNRGVSFDPRDYLSMEDMDAIEIGGGETSQPPAATAYQAYRCSLINRSAGGLAVQLPAEGEPRIRVGELLAASLDDPDADAPQWLIATVRWLVRRPRHRELGMQYIGREVGPCALRLGRDGQAGPTQPALQTEIRHGDTHYHLLITTKGTYRPQRSLTLLRGSEQHHIQCTQLVESTGLYERFCFSYLD